MAFYNEINSRQNIVISFMGAPRYEFGVFARAYHLAANQLAENFLSKNGFSDYKGYPIVFLYRHAFELYLKSIICGAARLCCFKNIEDIDSKLYNQHGLSELARHASELVMKLVKSDPGMQEITNRVITTAKEFDDIDPISFSYRYPIDKQGNYSTKEHQVVNILSIHKNMDKLLKDLERLDAGLEGETDQAQEALAQEVYDFLNTI